MDGLARLPAGVPQPGEDPNVEAICNIFQRRYPNLELCKRPELVYDKENEKS